uniref:Uncharacterized protein n=1 Tax=Candidatus Kentrum sp. TC TaxID=2126339 RepID=A0A450Z7L3_9GAMM|nr:MAG: hypothetical protein BECKTC1821D_GA0114238_10823 [Candidatus Kentron sp. TC]
MKNDIGKKLQIDISRFKKILRRLVDDLMWKGHYNNNDTSDFQKSNFFASGYAGLGKP